VRRFVYDAGALIAAERQDQQVWRIHRRALADGLRPIVPATVLAQVRRTIRPELDRLLSGCRIAPLDEPTARSVGDLLGLAQRSDVVDAHVVVCCLSEGAICVTSDWADIKHLSESARTDRRQRFGRRKVSIVPV
jgi:hypothetical protein